MPGSTACFWWPTCGRISPACVQARSFEKQRQKTELQPQRTKTKDQRPSYLMQLAQLPVLYCHQNCEKNYGDATGRQCVWRAKSMGRRTANQVCKGHGSDEGKDEHAHDSTAHLISHQFL